MNEEEESQVCPLVTPYTEQLGIPHKTLGLLYRVRTHDPEEGPIPFELPPTVRKISKSGKEIKIRNYQTQAIVHMIKMPRHIDGHGVGLGKAQPLSAKILTPSGWVSMGELKVGDMVVDPDGGVGYVEKVFPQGLKQVFKVTTMDKASTECCEDHLWQVHTDRRRKTKGKVLSTKEISETGINKPQKGAGWRRSKFFLPITMPVEFEVAPSLVIPAYTMGVLLRDGGLSHENVILTLDVEIVNRVREEAPLLLQEDVARSGYTISRSCREEMQKLNLRCEPDKKFIPPGYLASTLSNRQALLQGLLDTDGECSKSGLVYYHTTSKRLAEDVAELVRSLGGVARMEQEVDSYYVYVKTLFNPFHLTRKKERWKPQMMTQSIESIEATGVEKEMQCIQVSTKRNLYITDNYIVTHNTAIAIVASAYKMHKKPGTKTIVFGTKSTTYQWKNEYENFTTLKVDVVKDSYNKLKGSEARLAQIKDFLESEDGDVLIIKYTSLIGRRKTIEGEFDDNGFPVEKGRKEEVSQEVLALVQLMKQYGNKLILICDEAQKFKSTSSQIRRMILKIQPYVANIWVMTATIIQNSLEEMYSISCAVGIRPFGPMAKFRSQFCRYRQVHVGRGIMKDMLIGYKNVKEFKVGMRPFYYGRSQQQVKEPIPSLSTIYHPIELTKQQSKLLLEDIPNGTFVLPPSLKKKGGELHFEERDPNNMMTKLSVFQLVTNHPALLDPVNKLEFFTKKLSPKEEMLKELLEGDLVGEKTLVFTKYRSWIDRFERLFEMGLMGDRKFLRITGAEGEIDRDRIKLLFQNDPDHTLLFINSAASEGVNLQQASNMVLLDVPWSWGQLLQTVGRMVRMASPHSACTLHILPAKGTVDEYAIDTLKGKGAIFETILGESYSAGVLSDGNDLDLSSGMEKLNDDEEFKKLLFAHIKSSKMSSFLSGEMIEAAEGNDDYKMIFEKKGKVVTKKGREDLDFSKWRIDD